MKLDIESISAPRSFIFLWCGSTAGTDFGRQCLQKWGFRRCEDICWIKTNLNRGRKSIFGRLFLLVFFPDFVEGHVLKIDHLRFWVHVSL